MIMCVKVWLSRNDIVYGYEYIHMENEKVHDAVKTEVNDVMF